jgi:glycosyltransferase involved in cell wall biosynthesis
MTVIIVLFPLRLLFKQLRETKFSLWTGTPIITMSLNAKAEEKIGFNSKSLVYFTYFITNKFDYNLCRFYSIPIIGKLVPFLVFIWGSLVVDRFHFYCDRGLLPSIEPFTFNFLELFTYKLLGIEVFLWTYGADVRSQITTKSLGDPNCCTKCDQIGKSCICDESKRLKNIEKLHQCSTAIFSMGDMIEYTPNSRNDLFFWPIDLSISDTNKYQPIYPEINTEKPFKIVHAPNHRIFKGTQFLIEAVDKLKTENVPIELILVEKIPNDQALEIYRSADIIFDQCLIGFHGYFALEGMAMGKPVMCYIRKPELYLLHPEECPIINTHINTLESDILNLINHREELREIGIKGRQYIEKYFTIDAFANRLKKTYQDLGVMK